MLNALQATALFQLLGKVYAVLSDPERRKIYDDCGELDDEAAFGGGEMVSQSSSVYSCPCSHF